MRRRGTLLSLLHRLRVGDIVGRVFLMRSSWVFCIAENV